MAAAEANLVAQNAKSIGNDPAPPVIDITPDPVAAKPQRELLDPRLLPTEPTTEPEHWEGYE